MCWGSRISIYLSIALGLAGIVIAVGLWKVVLDERRSQLDAALEASAGDAVAAIEEGLARQVRELRFLADEWARDGDAMPEPLRRRAARLIGMREGLEWLSWVGSDPSEGGRAYSFPGTAGGADEREIRFRWLDPVPAAGGDAPRRLAELTLPAGDDSGPVGLLVARFDMELLVDRLLAARATRYAVTLRTEADGTEAFYRRGEPAEIDWQTRSWRHDANVDTPFGPAWQLTLVPTADFAAARLGPLPDYLLAVGIVLLVVLNLLVVVLRRSFLAVEQQTAANRRLVDRESELTELAATLESRVAERTEELEDAIAELEAFNYSVSHDLRSPLGAILNFSSIIEEDHGELLGEDGLGLLARIRQSATRATGLLEDLLELSRAGRSEFEWERVDLNGAARSAFAQATAVEGGEAVEFHLDPLPVVDGDVRLIETVFQNLFTNALKYSRGREKRRIEVESTPDGDSVVVTVVDNGFGFDMRFAPKLFKVFERLHGDSEIEGNGVGLAIVSRIIKRHGGRVWADATPDVGARFSFSLPLDQRSRGES